MQEITEKTISILLKRILSGEDSEVLSPSEAEIFSVLNKQLDLLFSRLYLNKQELTESNQIILHDIILAQIYQSVKPENKYQITIPSIIQAFETLAEKYAKTSFPVDKIYFSDDIAILPGDGEVMLIGDPRTRWTSEPQNTNEEGFRPLYLHRNELDNPETKIKVENFLMLQKQNKNKIMEARVRHVSYLILEAQRHQTPHVPQIGQYDAVGLFEYLSGEKFDKTKVGTSVKKFLDNFFTALFESRHNAITSESILKAAKKLAKQQMNKITSASKKNIFSAMNALSEKPYSRTLINYFANRPDFVMLVFPDDTILPTLFSTKNSGGADQSWNMISIAGTSHYNMVSVISELAFQPFVIPKKSNSEGSILYGGYAYYRYKPYPEHQQYNFYQEFEHPIASHGVQKTTSLIVEELSDLMSVLLGGKGFRGGQVSEIIKRPKNIQLLSVDERKQFTEALKSLSKFILSLKNIIEKLEKQDILNDSEKKIWDILKAKLIESEKDITFYPRHIVSYVDLSHFPSIKAGDKIQTPAHSSWAGVELEVSEVRIALGNKAILHLIAPPLEKDHQLQHWVLNDLLFQIHNALNPGLHYADKHYWLPMETLGRLRGIVDNYPLAKDLLPEVLPFFELIDKNIKSAIHQQFFQNLGVTPVFISTCHTAIHHDQYSTQNALTNIETYSDQNPFDYGLWDDMPTLDKLTGKPIFTYRVYQGDSEVGSAEFYGQPLLCRSEDGLSHNLIKTTGVLNNFQIADNMAIEEICHSLPPSLSERALISAGRAAIHGGLRGVSHVTERALRASGVSDNAAYCTSQFMYYSNYFAWRVGARALYPQEYNNPDQLFNALYSAAIETGHIFLINTVLDWSKKLLEKANFSGLCSLAIPFGIFAYHAATGDAVEAAAAITAGVATELLVEHVGNYVMAKK